MTINDQAVINLEEITMARYLSLDPEKYIKIRDSAISLFSEQKIKNTTIEQIAKNANIAKGTVYLYFKNREELERYIFDYCFDLHLKASVKDIDNEKCFIDKLKKRIKNILMWDAKFPKESYIISSFYTPVNYSDTNEGLFSKSYEINKAYIEAGMRNGEFKSLPIEFLCKIVFSSVEGISTYIKKNPDALYDEDLLNQLIETVIDGIKIH